MGSSGGSLVRGAFADLDRAAARIVLAPDRDRHEQSSVVMLTLGQSDLVHVLFGRQNPLAVKRRAVTTKVRIALLRCCDLHGL